MSTTDSNSRDDLRIDLMQQTLSSDCGVSSSLSDHLSNASDNIQEQASSIDIQSVDNQSHNSPFDIQSAIRKVKEQDLTSLVEVLKFLQSEIVTGRALAVTTSEEAVEGPTNYITVDRESILNTTFSELEYITDYRVTFQVDFMGEESVDLGGPRKEWIRLMNRVMKEKYFDHDLRPLVSLDYYYVGIMMAIALLQNGKVPVFVEKSILQQILSAECCDPCVRQIQRGLEELGILSTLQQLPSLVYLLRPPAQNKMCVQMLLHILKPNFSEEGSNALKKEKEVYQMFVKYVREVAASRRMCSRTTLDLSHILQFATGSTEEPILGFMVQPSVEFILPREVKLASQQVQSGKEHTAEAGGLVDG